MNHSLRDRIFAAALPVLAAVFLFGLLAGPLSLAASAGDGADWPHWRGPGMDGISAETDWFAPWPGSGPKVVWSAKIGTGFSSMSICDGRLYTMGNTAASAKDKDQKDQVFCFDTETGKEIWRHVYDHPLDPRYYKGGPSATPTVADGRVYTFAKKGLVFCLDAKTGKEVWSRHLGEKDGFEPPKWGFAGSVLVHGDLLIINAGKYGVALKKKSGKIAWKSETDPGGYSTPLPFAAGGKKGVAMYSAKALYTMNPKTGKLIWEHPWITSYDVNAADPIFIGDRVFVTSGYKRGCALFKVGPKGLTELWTNKNMSNQCNSSVLFEGHIYGFDGNVGGKGILRCLDLETGESVWERKGLGTGSLMLSDGKLIILSEKGTLVIVKATHEGYEEIGNARILKGLCWTVPVLCNGKIYARCAEGDLVCIDPKTGGGEAGADSHESK